MTPLDGIAGSGLFVLLAIPVYWLQVHPFASFWRNRSRRLVFLVVAPVAWGASGLFVYAFRNALFPGVNPPLWAIVTGFALMVPAVSVFVRVDRELGTERLIGKAEVQGAGELRTSGLYARVRHPAYSAQMTFMLGLCFLSTSRVFWLVALGWWAFLRVAIHLEERELRARFGTEYDDYRRRVPAFLPQRMRGEDKADRT